MVLFFCMRIIFLNAWEGERHEQLTAFLKEQSSRTDILCLMEASALVESIARTAFPEHKVVIVEKPAYFGAFRLATFFPKDIELLSHTDLFQLDSDIGLGLYTEFQKGNGTFHIVSFHGEAQPGTKLDNQARINASQGIIDHLVAKTGPRIIGGDFNLLPETKSVQMFEEHGYTNQIKKHAVRTTRNRFAWDRYDTKQYYADYAFTSPEVKVIHFEVIENEVSDHLPLVLDITL